MSMNCITRLCEGRLQKDHVGVTNLTICDDIWFEILSRLPLKSLLICQLVCKSWRDIINNLRNNIMTNPHLVPLCGLLLEFFDVSKSRRCLNYICLKTGKICKKKGWLDEEFMVKSGYSKGMFSNLSFNFLPVERYYFETIHQGLSLFSLHPTGACRVYDPVTKKMFNVPKSLYDHVLDVTTMIVRFPTSLGTKCEFIIVRIFRNSKIAEVYRSTTMSWKRFNLVLDDEIVNYSCLWNQRNYVALVDGFLDSHIYILTNKNCGVALQFIRGETSPNQYTFPLPQLVHEAYKYTSLWDCGGTLHLSYYSANGLFIWKHHLDDYGSTTQANTWSWVPLLQYNNSPDLFKTSLVAGHVVRPLACHPDVPVMFVLINHSSIFAYDLSNGALDKIVELDGRFDEEDDRYRIVVCFPFKPCLSYFDAELCTTFEARYKVCDRYELLIGIILVLSLLLYFGCSVYYLKYL